MQNTSIRRLGALATVLGSLALVNTAAACPNRRQAQASPQVDTPAAAQQAVDCPYSRGQSCGLSFGSKLFAATVPVGLMAFGLGWLSLGRRRRARADDTST